MELEDYEQDLITDLLARDGRFDPVRAAYPTFADRVIRHRVSTLVEARVGHDEVRRQGRGRDQQQGGSQKLRSHRDPPSD